jgi:hypothetical protein
MSPRQRATATQSMKFVAVPLLGVVIGVAVAFAQARIS